MDIIRIMESCIKNWTGCDKLSANLAANDILNVMEKEGFEITVKEPEENEKI